MLLIISIAALFVAFYLFRSRQRRRSALRRALRFDDDSSLRLCISVVATDIRSVGYIAALLSEESNSYQVVAVSDFSQNEPLLRAITHYFGLFRVSYITQGTLPDQALRGVFRSHRRLYSKLVVVDSAASENFAPLNAGVEVSSYDYILHLKYPQTLRRGAIEDLLLELAMRHEGSVEKIVSRFGERAILIHREKIANSCALCKPTKRGRTIRLDYNILE